MLQILLPQDRRLLAAALVALCALAAATLPARAQSANAPPVVDAFTAYWEPHPTLAGQFWLHTVTRVRDIDSARVFARVLVLDRANTVVVDVLLGSEEDGERVIEGDGHLLLSPDNLDRMEVIASDVDGNTLEPIRLAIPPIPTSASPKLRDGKLNAGKTALLLKGNRMNRILGVEINGERIPASALTVRKDGKRVRVAAAIGELPLTEGFNSIRVETAGGGSNEVLIRK